MTNKITPQQENHISDLFRDSLRALSLSKEEAQEIIESGGIMQHRAKEMLKNLGSAVDKCSSFPTREFEIMVPNDYVHDSQIDRFAEKAKKSEFILGFENDLTSENFSKTTDKLQPGKKYKVKIFPIMCDVTSDDCLRFMKHQKALLVGAQGLTLVADLSRGNLPTKHYTVSFDKKDTLPIHQKWNYRMVPYVLCNGRSQLTFQSGSFESSGPDDVWYRDWSECFCLLCFYELN